MVHSNSRVTIPRFTASLQVTVGRYVLDTHNKAHCTTQSSTGKKVESGSVGRQQHKKIKQQAAATVFIHL